MHAQVVSRCRTFVEIHLISDKYGKAQRSRDRGGRGKTLQWGRTLKGFVSWNKKTGNPFEFGSGETDDNFNPDFNSVLDDIEGKLRITSYMPAATGGWKRNQ